MELDVRLDDQQLAKLAVLCHAHSVFIDYLFEFDEAVRSDPEWHVYKLVADCFNRAVEKFGVKDYRTDDVLTLCHGLLKFTEAALTLDGPQTGDAASKVADVFSNFRTSVLTSPPVCSPNFAGYIAIGEALSTSCYRQLRPSDELVLPGSTSLSFRPANENSFHCRLDKPAGVRSLIVQLAVQRFTLETYLNLGFYLFHEYCSHIHSAQMYAEQTGQDSSFTDGWLIYAQSQFYSHTLHQRIFPVEAPGLRYREHFLKKYIHREIREGRRKNFARAYDLAERFAGLLPSNDLFWIVTLGLASVSYTHLGSDDVHSDFLIWLAPHLERLEEAPLGIRKSTLKKWSIALQHESTPLEHFLAILQAE